MKKDTAFNLWNEGIMRNLGSFQTALFSAYQLADSGNRAKLETAFPHWFVNIIEW